MRTKLNRFWVLLDADEKLAFSADVGVSYFTASHYLNGTKTPSAKVIAKMVKLSGKYGDKLTIVDFNGKA